jgi:hypothetical protein
MDAAWLATVASWRPAAAFVAAAPPAIVAQDPANGAAVDSVPSVAILSSLDRTDPIPVGVQHAITGRAAADSALATARSAVAAAQARELATALAWEHEHASVAGLARQLAEAELLLGVSPPVVADADSSPDYEASIVANLHAQAADVQNIRSLVSVVLDANSSAYAR